MKVGLAAACVSLRGWPRPGRAGDSLEVEGAGHLVGNTGCRVTFRKSIMSESLNFWHDLFG